MNTLIPKTMLATLLVVHAIHFANALSEPYPPDATQVEIAEIDKRYAEIEKIEGITNQVVLAEIAKNEKDGDMRAAAMLRLTNQTVFAEIAKNDDDERACHNAITRALLKILFPFFRLKKELAILVSS